MPAARSAMADLVGMLGMAPVVSTARELAAAAQRIASATLLPSPYLRPGGVIAEARGRGGGGGLGADRRAGHGLAWSYSLLGGPNLSPAAHQAAIETPLGSSLRRQSCRLRTCS